MATVKLYGSLHRSFRRVLEWVNDTAALVNELRTDHATFKTSADAVETLIEELHDDHATFKTAADNVETLIEELHDDHATFKSSVDDLASRLNQVLALEYRPRVAGNIGAGLSVDANAQDIEMDSAISVMYAGLEVPFAQEDPIDVSTKTINGRTIATSRANAGWVFADLSTGLTQMDQSETASTAYTTAIAGLGQYSRATTTLPPNATCIPIGAVSLLEGGSGTFTWGAESITDETEVYYSFRGLPGVITAAASFAATGGASATFAYGAGICRLGTGTVVSYTGKAGVAFSTEGATNVTDGNTGLFLLYVLADDSEYLMQLGGAGYATLALAQAAFRDHNMNPLMPVIGYITVQNASGADFVPGTTNLNVAGLTNTFTICGTGSSWQEQGRTSIPFAPITNLAPATLASSKPASAPATLTAAKPASAPATITAAAVDDFTDERGTP